MALQLRRGTSAENDAFTGLLGEQSFDTTKNQMRLHDGATAGGHKVANATGGIIERTIAFMISGGGSAITTGSKGFLAIDYDCTIISWSIFADQTGSIVVDVKKSTYAGFPTTSSIAGTEKPTLSAAQKNQDTTLTTWTTAITAGDVLEFVVDSASTVTSVTVTIKIQV